MREQLNCPNCGQPITSERCEYCGTVFLDFANITFNNGQFSETYLRINIDGKLLILKAIPTDVSWTMQPMEPYMSVNMSPFNRMGNTISLNFWIPPDDDDNLLQQITQAHEEES